MSIKTAMTGLADQVRRLSGLTEPLGISDMAAALRGISFDGTWQRPGDWPDYGAVPLDDFEGMYFTYDTEIPEESPSGFCGLYAETADKTPYTVERGQIVNGVFTAAGRSTVASGTAFEEWLRADEGRYVVYRLTANANITSISMAESPDIHGGRVQCFTQNCVERYGRLPHVTRFGTNSSSRRWGCYHVVADTIHDCIALTTLANCWANCYSLRKLDIPNWYTGYVTTLASCWQNCYSLQALDIRDWDTGSVTSLQGCWAGCCSLTRLDIPSFLFSRYLDFLK